MPFYAIWSFVKGGTDINPPTKGMGWAEMVLMCCSSVLLGVIEFPMLCSCYTWCKVLQRLTTPVAGIWLGRAAVHLLIGGGICALGAHGNVRKGNVNMAFCRPCST